MSRPLRHRLLSVFRLNRGVVAFEIFERTPAHDIKPAIPFEWPLFLLPALAVMDAGRQPRHDGGVPAAR